ncbi:MAG: hypothetical protein OEY14_19025 [Myxococcales bacterium]|nr:hypothetical protein [Myxococcales bacterium]
MEIPLPFREGRFTLFARYDRVKGSRRIGVGVELDVDEADRDAYCDDHLWWIELEAVGAQGSFGRRVRTSNASLSEHGYFDDEPSVGILLGSSVPVTVRVRLLITFGDEELGWSVTHAREASFEVGRDGERELGMLECPRWAVPMLAEERPARAELIGERLEDPNRAYAWAATLARDEEPPTGAPDGHRHLWSYHPEAERLIWTEEVDTSYRTQDEVSVVWRDDAGRTGFTIVPGQRWRVLVLRDGSALYLHQDLLRVFPDDGTFERLQRAELTTSDSNLQPLVCQESEDHVDIHLLEPAGELVRVRTYRAPL